MNIFILASIILFAATIASSSNRQKKKHKQEEQSFWARERAANSVRRKSLDTLDYIHIPLDRFPMDIMKNHPRIAEYQELVKSLSTQPIVNLTGYSNTDLKLEYGTANITQLSEYDQNYTVLVRTLQQWADILYDADCVNEAEFIMEFAVSTGSDISRTYYRLADIYASRGEISRIEALITSAEQLRTPHKNSIVRTLQEAYQ